MIGKVLAQGYPIDKTLTPNNVPTATDFTTEGINKVILTLVGGLMTVAAAVAIFFIFQGGFMLITSRGNDESTGKAKKTITWAILGLVVMIFAYQIVKTVIQLAFT